MTTTKRRVVDVRDVRLVDDVMKGTPARVRVRAPKVLSSRRLTDAEMADVSSKVRLASVPGKGLGLVARKALKKGTRIGVYGGEVFGAAEHRRLVSRGMTTGKYAVLHYSPTSRGSGLRGGYVMDPAVNGHDTHANVLAAFINEPAEGEDANTVWAFRKGGSQELWTTRDVAPGEELTACYGTSYKRAYKTSCTRRPGVAYRVTDADTLVPM